MVDALPGLPKYTYGVMDQLICSVGTRFVGSFGSTFTAFIHRIRGHHMTALVPDKGVFFINSPAEEVDYLDSLLHNKRWANSVWWPTADAVLYTDASWCREFSFTWDMTRNWEPPPDRLGQDS